MIWKKIFWFRRREKEDAPEKPAEKKSFLLYTRYAPQILTWFRREKGIPRKDLQLVVIDDEEQPAWKVVRLLEILITDLITIREEAGEENVPGNLVLDLRDWEKHLDIISEVGYNTLIM